VTALARSRASHLFDCVICLGLDSAARCTCRWHQLPAPPRRPHGLQRAAAAAPPNGAGCPAITVSPQARARSIAPALRFRFRPFPTFACLRTTRQCHWGLSLQPCLLLCRPAFSHRLHLGHFLYSTQTSIPLSLVHPRPSAIALLPESTPRTFDFRLALTSHCFLVPVNSVPLPLITYTAQAHTVPAVHPHLPGIRHRTHTLQDCARIQHSALCPPPTFLRLCSRSFPRLCVFFNRPARSEERKGRILQSRRCIPLSELNSILRRPASALHQPLSAR
jgi:hypothetical protein